MQGIFIFERWESMKPYKTHQLLKMAIEIVDFPIKNGDFPVRYVSLPEGIIMFFWFFL